MNPIVRMMKRYIKMPLKYALRLLFIGALVLASTKGCTSSNGPPATPKVKATVAATATVKAIETATATPTVQGSNQNVGTARAFRIVATVPLLKEAPLSGRSLSN